MFFLTSPATAVYPPSAVADIALPPPPLILPYPRSPPPPPPPPLPLPRPRPVPPPPYSRSGGSHQEQPSGTSVVTSSSCATKKPSAVENPATRQSCSPLKLARSPTTGRRKFPVYWQSVPTNVAQPTPQARARVASRTVARGRSTAARPVVMPIQKRRPQPVPTRVMATPKDRSASTQPSRKNCQDGEEEGGDERGGRRRRRRYHLC